MVKTPNCAAQALPDHGWCETTSPARRTTSYKQANKQTGSKLALRGSELVNKSLPSHRIVRRMYSLRQDFLNTPSIHFLQKLVSKVSRSDKIGSASCRERV